MVFIGVLLRTALLLKGFEQKQTGDRYLYTFGKQGFSFKTPSKKSTLHRTKLRVSVHRKSGGNAQTYVSVPYPNRGIAEIDVFEICSSFRCVSSAEIV